MITRAWWGRALPENADAYVAHLRADVLGQLNDIKGHRGAYVLRRPAGEGQAGEVEFAVLTLWDSMDAIRQFAGEDPDIAVVPPAARAH